MKTRTRRGWLSLLVVLMGLTMPRLGWACLFDGPIRIEDQARGSDIILLGTVVEMKSYFGVDRNIYTDVTLRVEADLKNPSPPAEVIITVFGGRIGNLIAGDTCAAGFSLNERVLLFLMRNPTTGTVTDVTRLDKYLVEDDQVRGPNVDWLYGHGAAVPLQAFIAQVQAALTP